MSKPDDIPQDIWDEADEWSGWPLYADLTYADQVTNRRHALSPDGWALLSTEKAFVVHAHDLKKAKAA